MTREKKLEILGACLRGKARVSIITQSGHGQIFEGEVEGLYSDHEHVVIKSDGGMKWNITLSDVTTIGENWRK